MDVNLLNRQRRQRGDGHNMALKATASGLEDR
jgi:hypothetical protein